MSNFLNMLTDGYHWIFLTALILLGFCAVRDIIFGKPEAKKPKEALKVLQIRLASGKISEEEYVNKAQLIQSDRHMYS